MIWQLRELLIQIMETESSRLQNCLHSVFGTYSCTFEFYPVVCIQCCWNNATTTNIIFSLGSPIVGNTYDTDKFHRQEGSWKVPRWGMMRLRFKTGFPNSIVMLPALLASLLGLRLSLESRLLNSVTPTEHTQQPMIWMHFISSEIRQKQYTIL